MKGKKILIRMIVVGVVVTILLITFVITHKSYDDLIEEIYADIIDMKLSKAYLECERAYAMEPKRMETYEAYAMLYEAKGDYEQTEEQLKKGIAIGTRLLQENGYIAEGVSGGICKLAWYYIEWHRNEDAIELLRSVPEEFQNEQMQDLLDGLVGKEVLLIQDYAISWADSQMESVVRELLHKPEGTIYASEVWNITKLEIWGTRSLNEKEYMPYYDENGYLFAGEYVSERGNIQTLEDLRHFENLEELSINFQENLNIDFFEAKQLARLRKISFVSDGIQKIDSLMWIRGLTELKLDYNVITEYMWISRMEQLNVLSVKGNPAFYSTELLEGMVGLRYLDVSEIPVTDVERISEIPCLEELKIDNSGNMTLLPEFPKLKKLTIICDTPVLRFIRQIEGLTELRIALTETSDISDMSDLLYLQKLELANVGAEAMDLQILKDLPSLTELSLIQGQFRNYAAIAGCKNLKTISLPYENKEFYVNVVKYFPDEQIVLRNFTER